MHINEALDIHILYCYQLRDTYPNEIRLVYTDVLNIIVYLSEFFIWTIVIVWTSDIAFYKEGFSQTCICCIGTI